MKSNAWFSTRLTRKRAQHTAATSQHQLDAASPGLYATTSKQPSYSEHPPSRHHGTEKCAVSWSGTRLTACWAHPPPGSQIQDNTRHRPVCKDVKFCRTLGARQATRHRRPASQLLPAAKQPSALAPATALSSGMPWWHKRDADAARKMPGMHSAAASMQQRVLCWLWHEQLPSHRSFNNCTAATQHRPQSWLLQPLRSTRSNHCSFHNAAFQHPPGT